MKLFFIYSFLLITVTSVQAQIADSTKREIKLQGAVNFRDIGGYTTREGKKVKWGKLYRSAALDKLTANDIDELQKLSIAYDLDFRGPYEVKIAPDKIPATTTRISLPAGSENIGDSNYLKNMMRSIKNDSGLVKFYSDLTPFQKRYQPMFEELLQLNKDSSLLFHCSAGKDRTGIAAALILFALGVDEKTIVEDYLATNYYRRNENEKAIKAMVQYYKLDEVSAGNMMAAKESYIQSTFTSIKTQYGSIDAYLEKVMGLNAQKRSLLKLKFLE